MMPFSFTAASWWRYYIHQTRSPPTVDNPVKRRSLPVHSSRTLIFTHASSLWAASHLRAARSKHAQPSSLWPQSGWQLRTILAELQGAASDRRQWPNSRRVLRAAVVPRETKTAETAHTKVEADGREPQGSSSAAESTRRAAPMKSEEQTF